MGARVAVVLDVLDKDVVLVRADDIFEEPAEVRDGAFATELAGEEAGRGAVSGDGHLAVAATAEDTSFGIDESTCVAFPLAKVRLVLEARLDLAFGFGVEGDLGVHEDGGASGTREVEEEAVDSRAGSLPSLGGTTSDDSIAPRQEFEDGIEERSSSRRRLSRSGLSSSSRVTVQEGKVNNLMLILFVVVLGNNNEGLLLLILVFIFFGGREKEHFILLVVVMFLVGVSRGRGKFLVAVAVGGGQNHHLIFIMAAVGTRNNSRVFSRRCRR